MIESWAVLLSNKLHIWPLCRRDLFFTTGVTEGGRKSAILAKTWISFCKPREMALNATDGWRGDGNAAGQMTLISPCVSLFVYFIIIFVWRLHLLLWWPATLWFFTIIARWPKTCGWPQRPFLIGWLNRSETYPLRLFHYPRSRLSAAHMYTTAPHSRYCVAYSSTTCIYTVQSQ